MAGITWTDWYGDGSLVVVDVGLACCTLEYESARARRTEAVGGSDLSSAPDGATYAVVISGTVTDVLAPAVLAVVDACRQRDPAVQVVSFGACASSGGPYWDSYAVTKGIGQLVLVDAFVPGCPPPPDALERALSSLRTLPRPEEVQRPEPAEAAGPSRRAPFETVVSASAPTSSGRGEGRT